MVYDPWITKQNQQQMNLTTTGNTAEVKTYPTPKDSDGFFFEDEANEAMAIESQTYENGNEVRRLTLSDKTVAIVRQLTGKEMGTDVTRLTGINKDDYQYAMVAIATKFNGEGKTLEEVKEMKGKDYIKLQVANSQVNF